MSCQIKSEEHTDQLLAYAAGKLRGEPAVRLETHMLACEDCAAFGKAQSSVWKLMDTWEAPAVSMDFNRRLYAKIDAMESESWFSRAASAVRNFLQPVVARPAFPLAAASFLIIAGFVLDHPGKTLRNANQASLRVTVGETTVELDQVESTLEDMDVLRQFDPKVTGSLTVFVYLWTFCGNSIQR